MQIKMRAEGLIVMVLNCSANLHYETRHNPLVNAGSEYAKLTSLYERNYFISIGNGIKKLIHVFSNAQSSYDVLTKFGEYPRG